MNKKLLLFFIGILFGLYSLAQTKLTVHGYVQEAANGEKVVQAAVWAPYLNVGTTTNNFGYFSIRFLTDTATLVFSKTGFEEVQVFYSSNNADSIQTILFYPATIKQQTVTIKASRQIPIEQKTNLGQMTIPIAQIKAMPRFLGEADVLKAIQLLPGVQQGTEGTSGILVRGGGPDQNLVLLDGVSMYNTQHLFGIFSSFNADAIKNVEVYKGGFPARFGGRLSSVIDIVTKDGNMKEFHGEGGVGTLMSRLTLEGPIKKDKTSFLVSGRRTYFDILAQPFIKQQLEEGQKLNFGAYFYDLNLKLNHIISKKDRLYFSFFSGYDFFKLRTEEVLNQQTSTNKIRIGYGNLIGSARWNHLISNKLFVNTTVHYTSYRFLTEAAVAEKSPVDDYSFSAKYYSGIYDIGANTQFDYRPDTKHNIKFGGALMQHTFTPGTASLKTAFTNEPPIDTAFNTTKQRSWEANIYFEDDWEISDKLKINIGAHFSGFQAKTKFYPSAQPRIGLRYLLPNHWALKAGYTEMAQFIHLLTNSTTTLPTDLWVPSTDKVKPMRSRQFALGLAKTIRDGKVEASVEAYYKTMDGITEYKDGASYLNSSIDDWDTKVEQGSGIAKGIEILLQKKSGKTTGWIGYTLSKSDRVFENINFGKRFPYKYDRRHDFEITATHKFNDKWEISGNWGFSTANPVSLPTFNYNIANTGSPYSWSYYNNSVEYFNGRNGFRLLNYHRLDFGVTYSKKRKHSTRSWNLSFYNLYNKQNPFYYYIDYEYPSGNGKVKGVTLLPILPSLSYNFKF